MSGSSRNKMTWLTLESIRLWGAPVEIDETSLTLTQGRVLMGVVETAMDAGHKKEVALSMAVEAFRRMYDRSSDGTEWAARRQIVQHGGVTVRNKFYRQDQKERIMAKVRRSVAEEKRKVEFIHRLMDEAGRRNSRPDKGRVTGALSGLFDVLNKTDQEELLKSLSKRLGTTVKLKGPKS